MDSSGKQARSFAAQKTFDLELSQSKFDIQLYGQILERNPNFGDVLRRQAELFTEQGDYFAALELDQRIANLYPRDPVVHYNLACSLAMTGQMQGALEALELSLELGYRDFAHLEADSDLDSLRDQPQYQQLVERYGI